MKINRFRLIVNGSITLFLTKNNYTKILGNSPLINAVTEIIPEMEIRKTGMMLVPNFFGYDSIQVDKL